jgi:hypothetical protein
LVKCKTWTGFANAEEAYADAWVGQKIQPLWIEEEAKKLADTNFVVNGMFKPLAFRHGNLRSPASNSSPARRPLKWSFQRWGAKPARPRRARRGLCIDGGNGPERVVGPDNLPRCGAGKDAVGASQ